MVMRLGGSAADWLAASATPMRSAALAIVPQITHVTASKSMTKKTSISLALIPLVCLPSFGLALATTTCETQRTCDALQLTCEDLATLPDGGIVGKCCAGSEQACSTSADCCQVAGMGCNFVYDAGNRCCAAEASFGSTLTGQSCRTDTDCCRYDPTTPAYPDSVHCGLDHTCTQCVSEGNGLIGIDYGSPPYYSFCDPHQAGICCDFLTCVDYGLQDAGYIIQGEGRCCSGPGATCQPVAGTQNGTCCFQMNQPDGGLYTTYLVCGSASTCCVPNDGPCTTNTDCCSGTCNTETQQCQCT
jgi:hypothetical protein